MNDPGFQELFLASLPSSRDVSLSRLLESAEQAVASSLMELCPLQDAVRYRARARGRNIAVFLIDEKGDLDRARLAEMNRELERVRWILGPHRESDAWILSHIRAALKRLEEDREIEGLLKKFSPPLCHLRAEEIVRETLWPEPVGKLEPFHVRRAALAAWLTWLRQTTGSCFATAPAIFIQQNDPVRFFKDLLALLATGMLKRVAGGKEYAVPFNGNLGRMDLQRPLNWVSDAFSGVFSQIEPLAQSPGLLAAFEAGGLFDPKESRETKIGRLRERLADRDLPGTAEKLIRSLLLLDAGLTEEDLDNEAYLARLQMTPLLARQSAVYYQKPSERAQKVADWKKRFQKACGAFQALTECALLRAWEYTIASLCDVKVDFAKWNLYVGLGLHPEQKKGIGALLYERFEEALEESNREVESLQREYEAAVGAVRSAQSMLSSALSEGQRSRLQSELASSMHAMNAAASFRERAAERSQAIAEFFPRLLQIYGEKLQEYFQELFDPSLTALREEDASLYDDSRAGFRLVYKHGRADASLWTPIGSKEEYSSSLCDFFSAVEREILAPPSLGPAFVSRLTTSLLQYLQTEEFLDGAVQRAVEQGRRSPWDYFSGGTMETLLEIYYERERPFASASFVPHSEESLFRFLQGEAKGRKGPLLMRSPTHAFLFYPALFSAELAQAAVGGASPPEGGKWALSEEMQEHLAHRLSERLGEKERPLFIHLFRRKQMARDASELRLDLIDCLQGIGDPKIASRAALVDALLFETTPLLSLREAKREAASVLDALAIRFSLPLQAEKEADKLQGYFLGPREIYQAVLAWILKAMGSPFAGVDWELETARLLGLRGLRPFSPVLFADTNWSGWALGWIVHPYTGRLELWRLNRTAMQGVPMLGWKEWLNEKNEASWEVLYTNEFKTWEFDKEAP